MMKTCISYAVLITLCIMLAVSLFSGQGLAAGASGSGSGYEYGGGQVSNDCPHAGSAGSGGVAQADCNTCITSAIYQNIASGSEIINAMFTTLNSVLDKIMKSFYNGIVTATDFQKVIGAAILLYIAMYGLVITFALGTYRVSEVATRLVKVAFVYMLTSPTSWASFNIWVYRPIVGGMNQLIKEFTQVAQGGSDLGNIVINYGTSGASGAGLDATTFSAMFGSSMTAVFSVQLASAIMAMASTGFFGWLIAALLFWGVLEFLLMMIGAVITYAKAIIGLAFLFGVAPLFFIFLLFDRSRAIFMQWLVQVITFALQPVFLFAFLSFYVALINQAVPYLLTDIKKNPTNFCWVKWFDVPGSIWSAFMWRPTSSGGLHVGSWINSSGTVVDSPINVPNAIYFLMLCHLGKVFSTFIDKLAQDIGGGLSPGTVRGSDLGSSLKKGVGGALRGAQGKK